MNLRKTLITAMAAATLSSVAIAQKPGPPPGPEPGRHPSQPFTGPHGPRMEKQAFLGVATSPLDASLQAQLELQPGFGLLVRHIHPGSPADGALELHDVLVRFEDQRLVNQDQLAVLVRGVGAGAKVALIVKRGGKERVVEVTLDEREVPLEAQGGPAWFGEHFPEPLHVQPFEGGPRRPPFDAEAVERQMREMREQMERRMRDHHPEEVRPEPEMRQADPPKPRKGPDAKEAAPGGSKAETRIKVDSVSNAVRNATWVEDDLVLNFTDNGKEKRLTVDRAGERLFEGPVNNAEQRERIPESIREVVERFINHVGKAAPAPAAKQKPGEFF